MNIMSIRNFARDLFHRYVGRLDHQGKLGFLLFRSRIHQRSIEYMNEEESKRKQQENVGALFAPFYEEHRADFQKVRSLLADDLSKETYDAILQYRLDYDLSALKPYVVKPQYFVKDIVTSVENEIFLDGGAFIGDSSYDFIHYFNAAKHYKIYLWEPDPENSKQIKRVLAGNHRYVILPYALWDKRETLHFDSFGNGTSSVSKEGGISVQGESIDHIHVGEKITFIKMDIEGAEIRALQGASHLIQEQKPKLAICIYHQPSHLYEIPLMIKEMVPEYKLYIRHHALSESETVLYAVT